MHDRQGNVFELAGDFSAAILQKTFSEKEYQFTENGTSVTVNTTRDVASSEILQDLITSGFTIKYFRDISTSTKQLFKL